MEIKKGELHIWRYNLHEKDFLQEASHPILSAEEKRRASEFLYKKDVVKYVCNHVFRKNVLAKYLNVNPEQVAFSYSKFGKPFIENTPFYFSHTYRKEMALLAIYLDAEIGIDLEEIKPITDPKTFSEFSFSPQENEHIFSQEKLNEEVFFTYWTFKEAYIKATGTGLNVDISKLNLADFYEQETNKLECAAHQEWTIKRLPTAAGFKAAFALEGKLKNCIEFKYN